MRGLSVWDCIGGFLELDDLFIEEDRAVMHDLHAVWGATDLAGAGSGLSDFAPVEDHFECVITDLATEEGSFHVRDDGGSSDYESFDADHLVDICIERISTGSERCVNVIGEDIYQQDSSLSY